MIALYHCFRALSRGMVTFVSYTLMIVFCIVLSKQQAPASTEILINTTPYGARLCRKGKGDKNRLQNWLGFVGIAQVR